MRPWKIALLVLRAVLWVFLLLPRVVRCTHLLHSADGTDGKPSAVGGVVLCCAPLYSVHGTSVTVAYIVIT